MLATTSRGASLKTRKFAVKYGEYINRGRKTIEKIVLEARFKGFRKIAVVKEQKGSPSVIEFIQVEPDGSWKWLPEKVEL